MNIAALRLRAAGMFLLAGAMTSCIYFGAMAVLLDMNQPYLLAVTIAYAAAITFHFFANRIVTFSATGGHPVAQLGRYLLFVGLSYVLTLLIVSGAVELLKFEPLWGALLALAVTTPLSFVVSKYWIFAVREQV